MLDVLDETVARAFDRSVAALSAAGAKIETIDLAPLAEIASINANGGFAAAESWAFHRRWIVAREVEYDRRVALRIRRGETMSAADYLDLVAARRGWVARMTVALQPFDALLSPTVPVVAPPLTQLLGDDEAFFAANNLLLRNPSSVNFLDGCALSLPCERAGELPVGLMVWHGAGHDDTVLAAGLAIEAAFADDSDRLRD
jgi:amidase/aspartyl-tRNA(Asn)/glutamyl-tRNA(Gln) amidotransferase subunit A